MLQAQLTHLSGHVRSRLPVPVLFLFDALFQRSYLHSCSMSDLQHVVPLAGGFILLQAVTMLLCS